ncbi:hypothetical protein NE857_15250 [Nocardiopsis exhalans]|uniref:DUF8129 domain-containing protein n=1 Tax=Nocardiopsis exhalans TaxID=163604 RepID=A0ABY5DES8_9ACTN|nr:hypothetical protein [Nocardiopsis exhalans]USY22844.1 hypothetical protein NE857_15250 [Nocardiopsis exhalans]
MLARKTAPIEDYASVPVGTLRQRVRVLDAEEMRQLIAFEECHGSRPRVLEMLHDRLYQLEHGAVPSRSPCGQGPHGTKKQDFRREER